jgi:hypothetical protein
MSGETPEIKKIESAPKQEKKDSQKTLYDLVTEM